MPVLRPVLATAACAALGLVLSLPPVVTAAAQQATFRAATRTVPVFATVTDANGRLVPDLERDDFELYDNGKKQDITLFENTVQPVSVVVMLNATFTRVAQELHSQYLLGFSPQSMDGKVHTLDVRVTRLGLTPRARKSYVAK